MPRKRNIVLAAKQKKLLESRLIQINIVIEEYVYQGKQISATDAKAYIEEVVSYKAQRVNDARSLQVIEKITRCMKAIIEEKQEQSHTDKTDTHITRYCPSPVYSLPDEDRMMFSQESMNVNVGTSLNKDQILTIDLCDEEDDKLHTYMQVDVEIHRAMSGLSIREEEIQVSEPFSQSILENFEPEGVGILKKPTDFKICQTELLKKPILNLNSKDSLSDVTNKKLITAQKLAIKNVHFEDDDTIFIEPKEPPITKRKRPTKKLKDNNTTDTGTKKSIRQKKNFNKNAKIKENNKKKKRSDENNKIVPSLDHIKVKRTTNAVYKNNSSSDSANMKINDNQINTINNSFQKPANIICATKHSNSKSIGKIYNENIENDLSWIENITYVREVTNKEFDNKVSDLDDIFWNNMMFPGDWNDKDFDY